ncbi:MAG: hypothetical protein QM638_02955 [Nocardioides sp.]|uniref:hypothetical protein n=1 Tax=Nocardioides sp. TaxID=35761 RepID=UPI0039E41ACA
MPALTEDFKPVQRTLPEGIDREVAYVQSFTGIDLLVVAQSGPEAGRASTIAADRMPDDIVPLFAAMPEDVPGDDLYVSAVPLLPGMRAASLEFGRELQGRRISDLLAEMRRFEHGEVVFQQHGDVDYVIPIVIGIRPWDDEHRVAPGEGDFNVWMNQHLAALHGIDFGDTAPPANKQLWDLRR